MIKSLLERSVALAQYLQGIGAGANVNSSGETAVLSRLASHQDLCIFDVGANTGQFLNLACHHLRGRNFHVHAFEPGLAAFQQLCENASNCSNVTLNNFGLGAQPGESDLFSDAPGSQLASLTRRNLDHLGIAMQITEKVRIETLDQYCGERQIPRIDLLKIDVEGHELDVLYGARGMFQNRAIRFVTFEFGGCNIDTRTFVRDFFYFFAEYGMPIARITPSGRFYELPVYKEMLEQFRTTNFVAYHPT